MTRAASAPGKVLVSGEYAVLDGAPAIVMAVDRRARVRVSEAGGDWHRLRLPGIAADEVRFRVDDAGRVALHGPHPPPFDLSLVGHVCKAAGPRARESLQLELDTRPFFHEASRVKLGLGSSAALAVALMTALLPEGARSPGLEAAALAAHRAWQGGRGSGVDVAAAVRGGLLAYRAGGPSVEVLRWPDGLHWALLWSGLSSATADRVARFRASTERPSARRAAGRLAGAAEATLSAWRANDACEALESLRRYVRVLQAFDVDAGIGIFEAGHRELAGAAGGVGVVYKPCGAGGGDVGMAFSLERAALDRFLVFAHTHGFERLDVAADPRGAEGQGAEVQ